MQGEDKRLKELMADLRVRLKNVCSGMPQDEFEKLVRGIARNARNAELRALQWKPPVPEVVPLKRPR